MIAPAHLCQLYSFSRCGENGRLVMYSPMQKLPTMATANSQCRITAVRV